MSPVQLEGPACAGSMRHMLISLAPPSTSCESQPCGYSTTTLLIRPSSPFAMRWRASFTIG